mgnify:CR=1 FL=1|jgi:hypothetical protein
MAAFFMRIQRSVSRAPTAYTHCNSHTKLVEMKGVFHL